MSNFKAMRERERERERRGGFMHAIISKSEMLHTLTSTLAWLLKSQI
jgi:hypothetical protein